MISKIKTLFGKNKILQARNRKYKLKKIEPVSLWENRNSNLITLVVGIISMLSGIAAMIISWASAYFAYAAVKESATQREVSYQPQVTPLPLFAKFNITCDHGDIKNKETQTSLDGEAWSAGRVVMRVSNIGKGAAKDTGYLWNAGSKKHRDRMIKNGFTFDNNHFSFEKNSRQKNEVMRNEPLILPSDQSKFTTVYPPHQLIDQLEIQLARDIKKIKCDKYKALPFLAGPTLSIGYSDIGGKQFFQNYEINYFPTDLTQDISNGGNDSISITYRVSFIARTPEELI